MIKLELCEKCTITLILIPYYQGSGQRKEEKEVYRSRSLSSLSCSQYN